MARNDAPTYKCDAVGCKSQCTLDPREPSHETALAERGWKVTKTGDKESHYCPGCVAFGKVQTDGE